jgi:hypothetical protein
MIVSAGQALLLARQLLKRQGSVDGYLRSKKMETNVASFLLGETDEAAFLAAASFGEKSKVPGQKCEAWYFAAFRRELSGDWETAVDYYSRCLATGKKRYYEYSMAIDQLRRLKGTGIIGGQ